MAKKRKTLPKDFQELLEAGELAVLKQVFDRCEWEATGGYNKKTALAFSPMPEELARWLVEQGADLEAQDQYGQTPLHHQAGSWNGQVRLYLELGAEREAVDHSGNTPLHRAAEAFQHRAVRELLEHGANPHAVNKSGHTPLSASLIRCRNADIIPMAEIAGSMLEAGADITQEMKEAVMRIGKEFEFFRERFNPELLPSTDAALSRLYGLFQVERIEARRRHDGVSPITVAAEQWQGQFNELWDYLIPASGPATILQGEVIRIVGRVSHEVLDNGGMNWDRDFRSMLEALLRHLGTGNALTAIELEEAAALVHQLRNGNGDEEPARLTELAVKWVLANSLPIPAEKPVYRR